MLCMGTKKTLADYENDIITLHNELKDYPDSKTLQNKLSRRLSKWADMLDISVQAASNEQIQWTSDEIGFPTVPMPLKKDCAIRQTGDYVAYLNDYNQFCGLLVERKGVTRSNGRMISSDLYSTFSNEDNRRRFYAEVGRFNVDKRFDNFILICECSYLEYLSFKSAFNGKIYNRCNPGMNIPARQATIAKLYAVGCPVFFAGTRQAAVEMYRSLLLQWCRHNYSKIFNLDD